MRSRDTESFDDFYRVAAQRVIHLVYAATGDLTLAQDATSEAFARAWSDWAKVSTHHDPTAWVRTVARRIAISEWRRGEARSRAHTRHGAPMSQPEPNPDRVAVVAALSELSPLLRETVALHYLADRSVDQLAAELEVPAGTVKARLHRGRAQLAELLHSPESDSPSVSLPRKQSRHG